MQSFRIAECIAAGMLAAAAFLAVPAVAQVSQSKPRSFAPQEQEAANQAASLANNIVQSSTECARIASTKMGLAAEAQAYARIGNIISKLGAALSASKITLQAIEGNYAGATQTAAATAIDAAVCKAGPAKCAAWTLGRTIGSVINDLPAGTAYGQPQTVEDAVAQWYADWLIKPFNEENVKRMQAEYMSLRARNVEQQTITDASRQCLASEADQALVDRRKSLDSIRAQILSGVRDDPREKVCSQSGSIGSPGFQSCMASMAGFAKSSVQSAPAVREVGLAEEDAYRAQDAYVDAVHRRAMRSMMENHTLLLSNPTATSPSTDYSGHENGSAGPTQTTDNSAGSGIAGEDSEIRAQAPDCDQICRSESGRATPR